MMRTCHVLSGIGLLLCACTRSRPAPPSPQDAQPPRVPPGCERSLAGSYFHERVPTLRYAASDDGVTLTLIPLRAAATAGAPAPDEGALPVGADAALDAGAGAPRVTLVRGPEGFLGVTRASVYAPGGRLCADVSFPTEVIACDARGVRVRTESEHYLDEECRAAPHPPPPLGDHLLVRGTPEPSLPGDAGSAD